MSCWAKTVAADSAHKVNINFFIIYKILQAKLFDNHHIKTARVCSVERPHAAPPPYKGVFGVCYGGVVAVVRKERARNISAAFKALYVEKFGLKAYCIFSFAV